MLLVLSPAKTLDLSPSAWASFETAAFCLDEAEQLVSILREYSPVQLSELMGISDQLAVLNCERFAAWQRPFLGAKAAIFMFKGDVYEGFSAETLPESFFCDLQRKVRILSGLYGILRPFDAILPYRLEMGTRLPNVAGKDLYAFWRTRLTALLNAELREGGHQILLNLASEEYFKSLNKKEISASIVTPKFLEHKNGKTKMISFYAKRARGLMARFVVEQGVESADDLRHFSAENYQFSANDSSAQGPVFIREHYD